MYLITEHQVCHIPTTRNSVPGRTCPGKEPIFSVSRSNEERPFSYHCFSAGITISSVRISHFWSMFCSLSRYRFATLRTLFQKNPKWPILDESFLLSRNSIKTEYFLNHNSICSLLSPSEQAYKKQLHFFLQLAFKDHWRKSKDFPGLLISLCSFSNNHLLKQKESSKNHISSKEVLLLKHFSRQLTLHCSVRIYNIVNNRALKKLNGAGWKSSHIQLHSENPHSVNKDASYPTI